MPWREASNVEDDPDHGHKYDYAEPSYVHEQNTFPQSRALVSDLDEASSVNVTIITSLRPADRWLRGHAARGYERQRCNSHEGQPSHPHFP
jgi:hypothetical protein